MTHTAVTITKQIKTKQQQQQQYCVAWKFQYLNISSTASSVRELLREFKIICIQQQPTIWRFFLSAGTTESATSAE
jgi:hypothetical protein